MWSDVFWKPEVQTWTTFEKAVFEQVVKNGAISVPHEKITLEKDSYDTYIQRDFPSICSVQIEAIADVLQRQLSGGEGILSTDGSLNVFYVKGIQLPHYCIQIHRFVDEYSKQKRWKVLGWRQPLPDEVMGWGSHRPAGTHVHW